MGAVLAGRLRADAVFALALANPLQLFKLASVQLLRPSLEVLGPAGMYGATRFGAWLAPLLIGLLAAWAALPLAAAGILFTRRAEG